MPRQRETIAWDAIRRVWISKSATSEGTCGKVVGTFYRKAMPTTEVENTLFFQFRNLLVFSRIFTVMVMVWVLIDLL